MESIFGYLHSLVIILVLGFLLSCCRGNCNSSNGTILTPDKEDCFKTIDVNVSYNPYTLVDEEAGLQFRILSLRLQDKTNLYGIDAALQVGMDPLMEASASTANSDERCMVIIVEDSDTVIVTASNPISGYGNANRFIKINLDIFRNETIRSLSANYSKFFSTALNSVMIALVSTATCFVDENIFSVNVSVQESQGNKEFSTSGDGNSGLPLEIDLQLLSEFSTWALQLPRNSTDDTAMLTITTLVHATPTTKSGSFGLEQSSVHQSLRSSQTPVLMESSPNPDESLHRIILVLALSIGVIVVIVTVFVTVVTRRKCCPKNINKHTSRRSHRENANVPPAHDRIEETFQEIQNAAYNTTARDNTNRLHRPARLPHSRQRLGNVSYHIYEEIPSEIVVQTESTGSQNGNRREVSIHSLSESQLYATPYRRNRLTLPVPTRSTSVSCSSSVSGAYVPPDDQAPMTAAAALSKILLKTPVAVPTVRQPVSQDTILEEELELSDEEAGMDQNSTAIDNEYLVLCQ